MKNRKNNGQMSSYNNNIALGHIWNTCEEILSDLLPYSVRTASLHLRNLGTRIESKKAHQRLKLMKLPAKF